MSSVLHGDCIELMNNIPDGCIDMVLCDLPYGVTKNTWDSVINLSELWSQYNRVVKEDGAIILFGQDKFSARLMLSNEKFHRYNLIWKKTSPTGFLNARRMPLRSHEDILVFYKKLPVYNPQKTGGHKRKVSLQKHKVNSVKTTNYGEYNLNSYDSTDRFPISVLEFKTDKQKSALHPTQKPVALLEYLIKTYTNEGETVLDNAAGSGSTGEACENTNRNYILIEKEQKYIDVINNRLSIESRKR